MRVKCDSRAFYMQMCARTLPTDRHSSCFPHPQSGELLLPNNEIPSRAIIIIIIAAILRVFRPRPVRLFTAHRRASTFQTRLFRENGRGRGRTRSNRVGITRCAFFHTQTNTHTQTRTRTRRKTFTCPSNRIRTHTPS